tara:strand:- start:10644 stop:11102 length:459 start_codon:yes stop_codon:yes gene_type:complete
MDSWDTNRSLINGLWPEADFTSHERSLFNQAFRQLNQRWLREAIERTAMVRTSKKPYIAWIKENFKAIKEEESVTDFRLDIHKKNSGDSLSRENEFQNCRDLIKTFPDERLKELAEKVRRATGISIDVTVDVDEWSMMAVGLMAGVIEKGYT